MKFEFILHSNARWLMKTKLSETDKLIVWNNKNKRIQFEIKKSNEFYKLELLRIVQILLLLYWNSILYSFDTF